MRFLAPSTALSDALHRDINLAPQTLSTPNRDSAGAHGRRWLTCMQNRRTHARMLCADFLEARWTDKHGAQRRAVANLEDISASGACIHLDVPVPMGSIMRLSYQTGELQGEVRYCVYREVGYFVGVEFTAGWSLREFRPQHLLDPRTLLKASPAHAPRQTTTDERWSTAGESIMTR